MCLFHRPLGGLLLLFAIVLSSAVGRAQDGKKGLTKEDLARAVKLTDEEVEAVNKKEWWRAERIYSELIGLLEDRVGVDDPDAVLKRMLRAGYVYHGQGRLRASREGLMHELERLKKLDAFPRRIPADELPRAYYLLARVEHQLDNSSKAVEWLDLAIRLQGERKLTAQDLNLTCRQLRGQIRAAQNNVRGAQEDFLAAIKVLESNPRIPDANWLKAVYRNDLAILQCSEAEERLYFALDADDVAARGKLLREGNESLDRGERHWAEAKEFWVTQKPVPPRLQPSHTKHRACRERLDLLRSHFAKGTLPATPVSRLFAHAAKDTLAQEALLLQEEGVRLGVENQVAEAVTRLREADALLRQTGVRHRRLRALILGNLAALLGPVQQRWAEAAELAEEALDLCYEDVLLNLPSRPGAAQFRAVSQYDTDLVGYVTLAIKAGRPAECIYKHVLRWKGVIFAITARRNAVDGFRRHRELCDAVAEASGVVEASLADSTATEENRRAAKELRDRCERELAHFRNDEGRAVVGPNPEEFATRLPEGVVFLDFIPYRELPANGKDTPTLKYAAFVLRGKQAAVQLVPLSVPADKIANLDVKWRELLPHAEARQHSHRRREFQRLTDDLSAAVYRPVEEACRDARGVWVSPCGVLGGVSFAALAASDGRPLVHSFPIAYACSGRQAWMSMTDSRPRAEPLPAMVAVTDVQYADERQRISFGVKLAAELMTRVPSEGKILLTGLATTKERFLDGVRRGGNVCFVGHGIRGRVVKDKHLFLTDPCVLPLGEATPPTVYHDYRIPMSGANPSEPPVVGDDAWDRTWVSIEELVVVTPPSAERFEAWMCSGGLGPTHLTEGMVGFPRGLLMAGYRVVVAANWDVPQMSTLEVIATRYHTFVFDDKKGDAEAIRQAQLHAIALGGLNADPQHWAAWMVYGDPGWEKVGEPAVPQHPATPPAVGKPFDAWVVVAGVLIGVIITTVAVWFWFRNRRKWQVAPAGESSVSPRR